MIKIIIILECIGVAWLIQGARAPFAFGANRTFKLTRATIVLDVPPDWQDVQGLYGIPLSLLGPALNGARPSISITPTGKNNVRFNPVGLKREEQNYKEGRNRWLARVSGTANEFFPYQYERISSALEMHSFGYRYAINGVGFTERTYFVLCKGSLFHLKSVQAHEKNYAGKLAKIIRSFRCE